MLLYISSKVLETVFVLLASTYTGTHPDVFISIKELLEELMSTQTGLIYIGSNTDAVNGLIRLLLQTNVRHLEVISLENIEPCSKSSISNHFEILLADLFIF